MDGAVSQENNLIKTNPGANPSIVSYSTSAVKIYKRLE
jgi:hypothetical protein